MRVRQSSGRRASSRANAGDSDQGRRGQRAEALTQPSTRPTLRRGSSGSDVQFLQQGLKDLGYDPGPIDGIFGSLTERAVKDFQAANGLVVDGIVGKQTWAALTRNDSTPPPTGTSSRAELAQRILGHGKITLWDHSPVSSSGSDGADARSNMRDTADSRAAKRSNYDNAPGGSVYLDTRLLNGMLRLPDTYSFRVTSIAGGSHSSTSRHYAGVAMDIDEINSVHVNSSNPHYRALMQQCRDLGATEVLGPGDSGHSTHVHCAWPRP